MLSLSSHLRMVGSTISTKFVHSRLLRVHQSMGASDSGWKPRDGNCSASCFEEWQKGCIGFLNRHMKVKHALLEGVTARVV